ncbi:MAG TPA: hypothetical protein VIX12_02500, partial [Candidatus Binataceae bacterium]
SIFLFVTKQKHKNQTQYKDFLMGDSLHWQGQMSGKTDLSIIEHSQRGLELLLFYRDKPGHYADSGFRYEGSFEYVKHTPGTPASFVLRRGRD